MDHFPMNSENLESKAEPAPKGRERERWSRKIEYFLAVAGSIVGYGNIWRFPYLCSKNGGGVFLIPYFLFLFTCGIPLFILETSLGQYTGQGAITCWRKICPLFEGIGYGSQLVVTCTIIYYIIILSWEFLFLFSSFHSELPWANCLNSWNTDSCLGHNQTLSESTNNTSSAVEYWERRILGLSSGLEEMGNIRWDLALCLLLSWILVYACICKGIKNTGKVLYFTATFPYLILLALLVRGLTLPGAKDGLTFYLYPDLTRLSDSTVWLDAASQILYSYIISSGVLTTLSSYNQYNNNCFRDSLLLCILNSATSFMAGFAIFSVLGFMAQEQGVDVSVVVESGPVLAFIAYPRAVSLMPFPHIWAVGFYVMMIFVGLDTQFTYVETLTTSICDAFSSFFVKTHRRQLLLLAICFGSFFVGLTMVTEGGLYVFLLMDYYTYTGSIVFLPILESLCIGWVYGADRQYDNIEDMIGYRPWPVIKYSWRYITPALFTCTLLYNMITHQPLKVNNTYEYPWWGYVVGGALALSPSLLVPLWMVYAVSVTPGSLTQRLKVLCTPAKDLPCAALKRQAADQEALQTFT
ncbi:sodium- and chloride-dependent GABA transporter 2-like [Nerophis ophidion]|uniref:sodium- and chloride-dependent GABA transporter 2-like n=1 Tax=Nerophis ophidion TaxID=159077 RepID=UPI002AE0799C|nr:sodium- and chloride-dependent GABA transporter 2-like [Nerophis ophidion]